MTTDNEYKQFHEQLGYAVAAWAQVEHALLDVFTAAMQSRDWTVACGAFYGAVSFNTKRDITDGAVRIAAKDISILEQWKSIKNEMNACSRERGKLVHRVVITEVDSETPEGQRVYIHPPILNIDHVLKRAASPEKYPHLANIYIDDVRVLPSRFGKLSRRLQEFRALLASQTNVGE